MNVKPPAESNESRSNSTDRRENGGISGIRYVFSGQLKKIRRLSDHYQKSYFLDHYSLRVFSIIIGIILLSVIDAILTLYLIRHGAAEINPIMEHFLKYGPLPFLAAKYLLTTASVVLLLIYKNVHIFGTKIRAKYLFIIIFLVFVSVVLWEIFLILCVVD